MTAGTQLKEQAAELQSAQEAANEMRHAKVRALDALRDMEAQNTKLVRAYLDKKREAQQVGGLGWSAHSSAALFGPPPPCTDIPHP